MAWEYETCRKCGGSTVEVTRFGTIPCTDCNGLGKIWTKVEDDDEEGNNDSDSGFGNSNSDTGSGPWSSKGPFDNA